MMSSRESLSLDSASFKPGKEPHLGARLLELLPTIYGNRGRIVIGYFSYFRWVDNIVDEGKIPTQEKFAFLQRQFKITVGIIPDDLYPMEQVLIDLPVGGLPIAPALREKTKEVLASLQDDSEHLNYVPRRPHELADYNRKSLLVCLEAVGLIINEKPIRTTRGFTALANAWNTVGALRHFQEEIEQGLVRINLDDSECQAIEAIPDIKERKKQVMQIVNRDRFNKERNNCAEALTKNLPSIFELDIPLWQKIIAVAYISKVILKTKYFLKYPNFVYF